VRIRSIKPEFWRSMDVTSLSIEDRLLFIGLWSYVDDNGVGVDHEHSIIGDLFAADMFHNPRETVARVAGGLAHLSAAGLITRYTVDSRPYLFITNWEAHQRIDRPGKPRYPRSDAQNAILATPSREFRDTLATGTGEQGSSGTEEQGTGEQVIPAPAVLASAFDEAWAHWPKKVERKPAFEKFKIAARKLDPAELVAAIIRFGDAYASTTERQFVPALGAWLGKERWTDDLPTSQKRQTHTDRNLDFVAQLAREEQQNAQWAQEQKGIGA
jgi:hypothetical protein